ncbi:DNA primase [Brevibacterium phage Cantare]|uniref:DNA primase n=1 Tax=Brevibacterium phage Cantare TaxID=2338395 RepID=A0A3G3LYU8_9CAUD|nr:primase [Brevibacterium phage Cantare]AYQ99265.1 DNA primase [Brevibacterium phage Cantare]
MARYDSFAERHLQVVNRGGAELMCRCLYHDDSNASMQFNVDTGLWVCFGCGAKGKIEKLERELGLRVVEDAIDVQELIDFLNQLDKPKEPDDLPAIPEETLLSYDFPTEYWASRGFSQDTIDTFELGYDPLNNIGTIPFRNTQGELQGIIKRYLDPDVELRYRYPKGFKRSLHMFGSWMVTEDPDIDTVVLVEGSLDAIKCWQAGIPALAVYGSSVSKTQIRLLRRLGITKVILFFDDDSSGHKARLRSSGVKVHKSKTRDGKTYDYAEYDKELDLGRDFLMSEVIYEGDMPSDPGGMTSKQIRKAVRNAQPVDYEEINRFLKRNRRKPMRKFRR